MIYSFYVGCYTKNEQDKGIHLISLDTDSGELSYTESYYGGENPSFLFRSGNCLYASNEIGNAGKISALAVGANKVLTYLNSAEVPGALACYVTELNGFIYAANYWSGNIFGAELNPDGSFGKVVAQIQHKGAGPNANRQTGPHAHSVNGLGENTLIACDLGADKLFCYRQESDGSLVPDSASPEIEAPAGSGPRHMVIDVEDGRMYVVTELGVSVVSYSKDGAGWKQDGEYPLVNESIVESDNAADIHFTADKRRLYTSLRGKNVISAFDVKENGKLSFIGSYPTFGESPRSFCLPPCGEFIVIAHQLSGHINVCRIDEQTGALSGVISSVVLEGASSVINA